jgi:putative sterol carrier protein
MKAKQQAMPVIDRARRERLQRFATLKPLAPRARSGRQAVGGAAAAMNELAVALKNYPKDCRVQIAIRGARTIKSWRVEVRGKATAVVAATDQIADLRLAMGEGVWRAISNGELAPLAAFATGRLHVAGDCSLAKSLYRHLARTGTKASDIELF